MKKVLEEVSDRLIGDVATHHNVTPGKNLFSIRSLNKRASPSFVLEGSTIFAALSEQLDDLWDGGGKERQTNCEEKHLGKGEFIACNAIDQ